MRRPASTSVSPGLGGFLAFFLLAIALWLLMRNMNARLRRMAYRDEAEREALHGAAAGGPVRAGSHRRGRRGRGSPTAVRPAPATAGTEDGPGLLPEPRPGVPPPRCSTDGGGPMAVDGALRDPRDDADGHVLPRAFGWQIQPVPEMNYTMARRPEHRRPSRATRWRADAPWGDFSHPVVVIDVDDIDKALETVVGLGGSKVTERMQVGEMGWTGYFRDPEGNVIGLWQSA